MLRRLLRKYLRPYLWLVIGVLVCKVIETFTSLSLPTLNADIINSGVIKGDVSYIWQVGGEMLALTALQVVVAIIATLLAARTAMGLGRDVRRDVFTRVQRLNLEEMSRFGAPSLITRCTNDVQQIQMVVFMSFAMMVMAPIMMVGGVFMALRVDVPLSALIAVVVPILGVFLALILRRLIPHFKMMQKRIDRINLVMREQIQGVRVIRAFVRQPQRTATFTQANDELTGTALSIGRLMAILFPVVQLVLNFSSIAVIWFGGLRVQDGSMQVGDITAFLNYLIQILFSVMVATMMFMMVPRASVAAERVNGVLDLEPSIASPKTVKELPVHSDCSSRARTVTFHDVSFRYPGASEPVLDHVDLTLEAGTTTAVIGSTGAGKTTLLNLIPRLMDVTDGRIEIDGVDIRDITLPALRENIAVVPQKSYLFSGTLRSTLSMGSDYSDEQIWAALTSAQAADFVSALDEGLDTKVEQGGVNFSGGQRQRLCIARALLKPASVYLFDDSFSALDFTTDARLRAALPQATDGATMLVVAQRVSSIRHADQIVVLDGGEVVGIGSHEFLMDTCPTYQEIALSQLSVEEAA
ncbi:ABC transporter ATP-binding protein [Actinomyces vulturis]|uniref:ABC transporter ATP-binding protein n=1 Tax=Actinomyces vulturis TaxID=1857645 RepID=UPI00082B8B07|nr:ABC transporter ATP-binding protein [Actinomyces vulturis]